MPDALILWYVGCVVFLVVFSVRKGRGLLIRIRGSATHRELLKQDSYYQHLRRMAQQAEAAERMGLGRDDSYALRAAMHLVDAMHERGAINTDERARLINDMRAGRN